MTTLLYLMACLMSPAPLINLAESRVYRTSTYMPQAVTICATGRPCPQAEIAGEHPNALVSSLNVSRSTIYRELRQSASLALTRFYLHDLDV